MAIKFVFVQIGTFTPPYLEGNLKRLSQIFPTNDIYLITNHPLLLRLEIRNINVVKYSTCSEHEFLLKNLSNRVDFREGFWRLSLERLLALTRFQIQNQIDYLLHLESDVLIFPNFPVELLQKHNDLLWCQYNTKLDVASLLYSPNVKSALYLQQSIENQLRLGKIQTDMSLLNTIRQNNESKVSLFPSAPDKESQVINGKSEISLNSRLQISSKYEVFGGIFDPAAIGVWLLGKNPENTHALLTLHDRWIIESGDSYIDPSKIDFVYDSDGLLFFTENERQIPIFNLHVHSKDLKVLSLDWVNAVDKFVKLSRIKDPIKKFDKKVFKELLILNFKRGKLTEFLATLPWIYSIRMKIRKIPPN